MTYPPLSSLLARLSPVLRDMGVEHVVHEYANCFAENSRGQKIRIRLLLSASRADAAQLGTRLEVGGFRTRGADTRMDTPFRTLVATDIWGDEAELIFGFDALDPDTFARARKGRVKSSGVHFLTLEDRAVLNLVFGFDRHDGVGGLVKFDHNSALMQDLGARYGVADRVTDLLSDVWSARNPNWMLRPH